MYALSVAGPGQLLQAVSAGLGDGRMSFHWPDEPGQWGLATYPATGGFKVRKARLGYDTWHLVAVSKDPKFLLQESAEGLWQILKSDLFTTPLLRSWMPQIREHLFRRSLLERLDHLGPIDPAYLKANDAGLDRLVSDGVKQGWLRLSTAA